MSEYYSQVPDQRIIFLATKGANEIALEDVNAIKEEIIKRNLDPTLIKQLEAQTKQFSQQDILELAAKIQRCKCPKCGSSVEKLNGLTVYKVRSFLILTNWQRKIRVACPVCLKKQNSSELMATFFLGWWGFPWGLLKTPHYIYKNIAERSIVNDMQPNDALLGFIMSRLIEIESAKDNPQHLQHIVNSSLH